MVWLGKKRGVFVGGGQTIVLLLFQIIEHVSRNLAELESTLLTRFEAPHFLFMISAVS